MADTQVSDKVARPVRGGAQAVVAFAIVEFWDSFFQDLTEKQYGAAVGLLVIILSFTQVLVENWTGKAFLRRIPERATPVTDNDGRHRA